MKNNIQKIIKNFANEAKDILKENVIAEYLFGSYVKNTRTPLSDIDILIIVKSFTPDLQYQISGLASEYSLKYDVLISPILKDINVWEKNKYFDTLFYQEISRDGIKL
jgi:predicted nucleotidyltransferase